jgi:2-dehydro-3-deoxyphosphogluconate aldolase/(4S)-4-hydroxy-2-oxoglutarate aldolase
MEMSAVQQIEKAGVVPIIRAPSSEHALRISEVLVDAAMPVLEITFTVPGASAVIQELRRRFPGVTVGAGTVLDAATARAAISAGAQFLVSVVAPRDVVVLGRQSGIPVIPGAFTPSEILTAVALGADVVKLFPADVGGPGYLRGLLGPFPALRLFPTGGVTAANIPEWLAAGAVAVGVGTALTRDVAATGDYAGLSRRARELMAAVRTSRGQLPRSIRGA